MKKYLQVGGVKEGDHIRQRVRLVVVCACHSKKTGQAFVDAGIRHVIAIKSAYAILDDAAKHFSEVLYQHLFEGDTIQHVRRKIRKIILFLWCSVLHAKASQHNNFLNKILVCMNIMNFLSKTTFGFQEKVFLGVLFLFFPFCPKLKNSASTALDTKLCL